MSSFLEIVYYWIELEDQTYDYEKQLKIECQTKEAIQNFEVNYLDILVYAPFILAFIFENVKAIILIAGKLTHCYMVGKPKKTIFQILNLEIAVWSTGYWPREYFVFEDHLLCGFG